MTRVGVVVATKFPDMDDVRRRLEGGSKNPESVIVIRRRDHKLRHLLEELEAPNVELWEPEHDWIDSADAKACALLNDVDHMLVFHTPGSSTTDYYVKRAREWPYSIGFGPKTTVIEVGTEKKKRAKGRSKAE